MKKKKTEPLKFTVSFSDEIPTQEDVEKRVMSLFKLIFGTVAEKSLNSREYRDDEAREKARLDIQSLHNKVLDGIREYAKNDVQKRIDEEATKNKVKECDP